jgi:hypothetical protein
MIVSVSQYISVCRNQTLNHGIITTANKTITLPIVNGLKILLYISNEAINKLKATKRAIAVIINSNIGNDKDLIFQG